LEGISFFPISVGKVWTKRGKGINHRKQTKKVWQVYGYMQDFDGEIHFTSFRINPLQALWYRFNKAKFVQVTCDYCDKTFEFLCYREKPEECPGCEEEY